MVSRLIVVPCLVRRNTRAACGSLIYRRMILTPPPECLQRLDFLAFPLNRRPQKGRNVRTSLLHFTVSTQLNGRFRKSIDGIAFPRPPNRHITQGMQLVGDSLTLSRLT